MTEAQGYLKRVQFDRKICTGTVTTRRFFEMLVRDDNFGKHTCSDLGYAMMMSFRHEKSIEPRDWQEMFVNNGITVQDLRRVRKYAKVANYPKPVIRAMVALV